MNKKPFYSVLGSELKAARKKINLTQAEIATQGGCTVPTVRQAEKGGGLFVSFIALADVLELVIAGRSLPKSECLGGSLALLRKRQALSCRELSRITQVSPPTIAAIEANKIGNLLPVERIAATLGAGLFLHPKGKSLSLLQHSSG